MVFDNNPEGSASLGDFNMPPELYLGCTDEQTIYLKEGMMLSSQGQAGDRMPGSLWAREIAGTGL